MSIKYEYEVYMFDPEANGDFVYTVYACSRFDAFEEARKDWELCPVYEVNKVDDTEY